MISAPIDQFTVAQTCGYKIYYTQRAAVIDAINRGMEDKQSVYWKGSDPESEFCANVRYAGDDIYAVAAD